MYIVRYADDFKIFCRKRSDADKVFIAIKLWLQDRLKLQISEEKSKVVNLKRHYSEFLGFKLKAVKKGNKYVVRSHMRDKAVEKTTKLDFYYDEFRSWADEFDLSTNEERKMIICKLIKQIRLYKGYQFEIDFDSDYKRFLKEFTMAS